MGREGTGVTESAGKIRIAFTYQESRCRETLDLPFTPSNIKAATRLVDQIKTEIKKGIFEYESHFPKSQKIKKGIVEVAATPIGKTFRQALDDWLLTIQDKSSNTRKLYKNAAEVWSKIFFEKDVRELTPLFVELTVASHIFASTKLKSDYLIVLRGVCRMLARHDQTWTNPTIGIQNSKRQKSKPDPLTREEIKKVLDYIRDNFDVRVWHWFVFMVETGERPEEAIEHRFSDVDWLRKTIHVSRARTNGETGACKTYETRDIDLSESAIYAIKAMHAHPVTKEEKIEHIFHNSNTGRAWNSNVAQHNIWKKALTACKISPRRSYCIRHTFATTRLMLGVAPAYISMQMGHESPMMLFKTYSKWLPADTSERDRAMALLSK